MNKKNIEAGIVYYTTNYEILLEVAKKTNEIKNNDILESEFIQRMGEYITNKSGMILVSFNEKKELAGCMVVSRHIDKQGFYGWLDFAWCDKHYPQLMRKFEDEVTILAKAIKVERIQARTSRGINALNRRYGFYEIAKIIERKI